MRCRVLRLDVACPECPCNGCRRVLFRLMLYHYVMWLRCWVCRFSSFYVKCVAFVIFLDFVVTDEMMVGFVEDGLNKYSLVLSVGFVSNLLLRLDLCVCCRGWCLHFVLRLILHILHHFVCCVLLQVAP